MGMQIEAGGRFDISHLEQELGWAEMQMSVKRSKNFAPQYTKLNSFQLILHKSIE